MRTWALRLQLAGRRWPLPLLLLGLLLLGNALVFGWLLPATTARTQVAMLAAVVPPSSTTATAAVSVDTPAARLQAFQAVLGEVQPTRAQRTLLTLAAQTGLRLEEARYERAQDTHGLFQEVRMTVPVSGSYRAVRQFTERLLLALPYAALDKVVFKRESAALDTVSAHLTVVLFLQPEAAAAEDRRSALLADAGGRP